MQRVEVVEHAHVKCSLACFIFMTMKINCLIQGETLIILMILWMLLVIRNVTDAVDTCTCENGKKKLHEIDVLDIDLI
jgi:hypothetical protein